MYCNLLLFSFVLLFVLSLLYTCGVAVNKETLAGGHVSLYLGRISINFDLRIRDGKNTTAFS